MATSHDTRYPLNDGLNIVSVITRPFGPKSLKQLKGERALTSDINKTITNNRHQIAIAFAPAIQDVFAQLAQEMARLRAANEVLARDLTGGAPCSSQSR